MANPNAEPKKRGFSVPTFLFREMVALPCAPACLPDPGRQSLALLLLQLTGRNARASMI